MKNHFSKSQSRLHFILLFFIVTGSLFAQNNPSIYGYFSTRVEKIFDVPAYENGEIEKLSEDFEWQFPYVNLMIQHNITEDINTFLNLSAGGENRLKNIEVRNVWGEYTVNSSLKLRIGKSYKKFGLFNEILDAVPTYFGIEPPQYLNNEHEIISLYPRTTIFMAYGQFNLGSGYLNYALSFDKGLSESYEEAYPTSLDLNYKIPIKSGSLKIGASYFTSGGTIQFEEEGEEGEEEEEELSYNGTLPWMAEDEFSVIGGYLETDYKNFTLQVGYWYSPHSSVRNGELLEEFLHENENEDHVNSFLLDSEDGIDEDNIIEDVDYNVTTWYVRLAYSFYTNIGEISPYVQWDSYKNPEIIALPKLDEEHYGTPDNGEFQIGTIGLLYRPEPMFAIKFDFGLHRYDFYGESVSYPEFKLDFSFIFGQ